MPKIKFLQDFRGTETNEVFYKKDEVVDVSENTAERLVKDGRAVVESGSQYDVEPQFEQPVPEKKRKRGKHEND
jgi:hypothetical protein